MTTVTPTDDRSHDWHWQLRAAVREPESLARVLSLSSRERQGLELAQRTGMPLWVPPYYLALCDPHDPTCPIRRQCVPTVGEANRVPGDLLDPLGEDTHEVAPRLVRRYPDRALLLATFTCAVHCRFCTRSRLVRRKAGFASATSLEPAMQWLRRNPDVTEVLVSGGDPLVASTVRLHSLLSQLRSVPSVELIRIGTRVPAVLPMRIDDALLAMLRRHQPIWIMTHFNHPKELTPWSTIALAKLVDAGLPVMNQTVLLRGVNDDEGVLASLFRGLVRRRVRPYYLLHADVMEGTGHFRTPLEQSIRIVDRLQGRLSGLAVPRLMVDTPGGAGKVPVGADNIVSVQPGRTVLRTYRGDEVTIVDPP